MKKRIISLFLALVLLLGIIPVTAAAEAADVTMSTGHVAEFVGDRYLSQIVLKNVGGTATGSEYNWDVVVPADTDTTQPLSFELTGAVGMALSGSYYFWAVGAESASSTTTVATQNPVTLSVLPQWENGHATVAVGIGTDSEIKVSYYVNLHLEGAAEDLNKISIGESGSKKYFIKEMYVTGAEVTDRTVSDTSFSGSTSGHKATVDITLAAMPEGEMTLDLTFMATGSSYISSNGADRVKFDTTYSLPIDLSETTSYVLITYSTASSSIVRGTYTVNFSVEGMDLNQAPVLADGVSAEAAAQVQYPDAYTLDLTKIFTDANGDDLTYSVSIDGAEAVEAAASYSYVPSAAGTCTLVFNANDGKADSEQPYTVTLTVLDNSAPELTVDAAMTVDALQYETWTLDLATVFTDPDGDAMTYLVDTGSGYRTLSGSTFTYTPGIAGTKSLTFKANDDTYDSEELTVTLNVAANADANVLVIGQSVDSGSFDFVKVTDTNGSTIDADMSLSDTAIHVVLPRTVGLTDTVRMHFGLTQNSVSGSTLLPFVSTKNAASGTSSNRAQNNIVTYRDTTLSAGAGTAAVYFYDHVPAATTNTYTTYTISYAIANSVPVLAGSAAKTEDIVAGTAYHMDLSTLFADADGDSLSYTVSINGADAVEAAAAYSYTPSVASTDVLVFTATDGMGTSEAYTLTLKVSNTTEVYDVTIHVPEGLAPVFYATSGYDADGVDTFSETDPLAAQAGSTADGFTAYTVKVPVTASTVSFRDADWGGMSVDVTEGTELYLEDFSGYLDHAHDGAYVTAEQAVFMVKDNNGHYAVSGGSAVDEELGGVTYYRFLLAAVGNDGTYTLSAKALGDLADTYGETIQDLFALEPDGQTFAALSLTVSDPIYIVVPAGAEAGLYRQYNNYNTKQIAPVTTKTADGVTTFTFKDPGGNLTWRAWDPTDETKITKAGYIGSEDTVTVTWEDTDPSADTQVSYSTDTAMGMRYDATVAVNVNSQNHLVLEEGGSYRLRGFRWWQVINNDVSNIMIEPDFNHSIVSGSDVISIDAVDGGNASGNWMDITATGTGMAVVEVGFDALAVSGMGYSATPSFVYGACDPDRTALVVVSVGETVIDADFGFVGANGSASWDAEFDTLYFLGDTGYLTLTPAASGTLSVSHDKGLTWKTLTSTDGTYRAPIVSGSNILKLETADGVDYQVVRGDKLTAVLSNMTSGKQTTDPVAAGDTVQIELVGMHHVLSKMSGIYNPNYGGASVMNYTIEHNDVVATSATGSAGQYQILRALTFTIPTGAAEGDVIELTGGFISYSNMGSAPGVHRSITDSGVGTNTSASSAGYKGCILPEMKLTVGSTVVEGSGAETVEKFDIAGANMTLGNELEMNVMFPKTAIDNAGTELTAYVTHYSETGDVVHTFTEFDAYGSSYYKLSFRVAAAQMTDTIAVEFKDADGNVYNNEYTNSVRNYVMTNIGSFNATIQTLMVDMLNYGAAAQDQFTYHQDAYANALLSDEQKALATGDVEVSDLRVQGTNYAGSTLSLEDRILLNIVFNGKFTADELAAMSATVSFDNALDGVTQTHEDAAITAYGSSRFQVTVDQIVLADSSQPVTVTVYNADGTEYGSAVDSVSSYIYRMDDGTNPMYSSIMKFATSALAYGQSKQ